MVYKIGDKAYKRQHYLDNEELYKERARIWRLNNPDKVIENNIKHHTIFREENPEQAFSRSRRYALKAKYGLTPEDYNNILKSQNNSCKLCKRPETDFKQNLAVDHNHYTNEIRGLLCNHCNHKIVGLHKDGTFHRAVANYIENGIGLFVPAKNNNKEGS